MASDPIDLDSGSTERSPLLGENRSKSGSKDSIEEIIPNDGHWYSRVLPDLRAHWIKWKVVYVCGAFVLFVDVGGFLSAAARIRMLEAAICRRFYETENPLMIDEHHEVPERLCKLNPIQKELAFINGWQAVFEGVICVISSIPWGVLADRKGRRFVCVVAIIGLLLSEAWTFAACYFYNVFHPRVFWVSSLFLVLGGGSGVVVAIIFAVIADASPPDIRATVLFQLHAAVLASLLVSPPIGAILLRHYTYWVPVLLGFGLEIISSVFLYWMPTVAQLSHKHVTGGEEETAEVSTEALEEQQAEARAVTEMAWPRRILSQVEGTLLNFKTVFDLILGNSTLAVGVFVLLLSKVGQPILSFLPQYASKRFGWTLGDASYISSVQAAVSIVMLVLVLPLITRYFNVKLETSGPRLDLKLARGSIPFAILGCFLLGWADTPVLFVLAIIIYVMGAGFRGSMESFLASNVLPNQMATLYVAINVFDVLGLMTSSPLLASAFSWGIERGGTWVGIPFIGASCFFLGAGILTGFLRYNPPATV